MDFIKKVIAAMAIIIIAVLKWVLTLNGVSALFIVASIYRYVIGSSTGYIYLVLGIICMCASEISSAIRIGNEARFVINISFANSEKEKQDEAESI